MINAPINILCVNETKLDSSFSDHQFKIEGYQFPPFRRDRNSKGGKISLFTGGFYSEKNCKQKKRKYFHWNHYCQEIVLHLICIPSSRLLETEFFEEISVALLLLAGDLNANTLRPTSDSFNHLTDFALRKKCPNTELFLVRIFLYSDWIQRFTSEYRKIRTRSNSVFEHFSGSVNDTFSLANLVTNSTWFK